MSVPLILKPYAFAANCLRPLLRRYTQKRVAIGKDEAGRVKEREGLASRPRPEGPLVWLHCASVGELNSVLPLIEHLTGDGLTVLVTTVTRTSAEIAARRLPPGAIHQYAPWDAPAYGRAFLDHWRPDLGLIVESELWPNMLFAARARGMALVQINARLSPATFARWRRLKAVIAPLLGCFSLSLAQSGGDAERLAQLGARDVRAVGNLKYDAPVPRPDERELARFRAMIGNRPVWLAASTHPGEEAAVKTADAIIRARFPDLLTVLAPRHPARADDVAALFETPPVRRTSGEPITAETGVFLLDTIGEMGLAYALAQVCFVGGSLVPVGGHTPLEPARAGPAILSGPQVVNFAEVYALLDEGKGWMQVADGDALGEAVSVLLGDAVRRHALSSHAAARVDALSGGLARTREALAPFIAQAKARTP